MSKSYANAVVDQPFRFRPNKAWCRRPADAGWGDFPG